MTDAAWVKFVIGGAALGRKPKPEDLRPSPEQMNEARRFSPIFQVRPKQPPALLMHGLNDRVVLPDQARAFAEAMKKAENRCDLKLIEGAKHAFILTKYTAPEATVVDAINSADRFLGSLGYMTGEPTLTVSDGQQ